MHLSSTVFTFNKPATTYVTLCVWVFHFGKNEKLLRRVHLPSQIRLTLTVQSPTCRFSSSQTALLRSYCKKKERQSMLQLIDLETNLRPSPERNWNLRLRLSWVVAQGHTVALDLVKALLTEVIPVGNKAIFWWTAASTHRSSSRAGKPAAECKNQGQTAGRQAVDRRKDGCTDNTHK